MSALVRVRATHVWRILRVRVVSALTAPLVRTRARARPDSLVTVIPPGLVVLMTTSASVRVQGAFAPFQTPNAQTRMEATRVHARLDTRVMRCFRALPARILMSVLPLVSPVSILYSVELAPTPLAQ